MTTTTSLITSMIYELRRHYGSLEHAKKDKQRRGSFAPLACTPDNDAALKPPSPAPPVIHRPNPSRRALPVIDRLAREPCPPSTATSSDASVCQQRLPHRPRLAGQAPATGSWQRSIRLAGCRFYGFFPGLHYTC